MEKNKERKHDIYQYFAEMLLKTLSKNLLNERIMSQKFHNKQNQREPNNALNHK